MLTTDEILAIVGRIREEAELSARPGQMDRLNEIADSLESGSRYGDSGGEFCMTPPTDSEVLDVMFEQESEWPKDSWDDPGERDAVLATLRKHAAIARAIESGEWKLVPATPTEAMIDAYMDKEIEQFRSTGQLESPRADLYRATLSAAPQFQEEGNG